MQHHESSPVAFASRTCMPRTGAATAARANPEIQSIGYQASSCLMLDSQRTFTPPLPAPRRSLTAPGMSGFAEHLLWEKY